LSQRLITVLTGISSQSKLGYKGTAKAIANNINGVGQLKIKYPKKKVFLLLPTLIMNDT
jgi:hypothetical protein